VELGFGNPDDVLPALDLTDGKRTFKLRGRIDRVDAVTDPDASGYLYLVDHKTSAGSLKPLGALRDGGALLQLQLYMNAVQHLLRTDRIFGGAYQVIRDLGPAGAIERASLVKAGLKLEGNEKQRAAAQLISEAPAKALDLIDGIAAGHFAARTPGTTSCLSYCALRHACREERIGYQP
jgi:RecB family exonuclease